MPPDDSETFGDLLKRLPSPDPEREELAEQARQEHEKAMMKAAIAWLREKWGTEENSSPCPYCGNDTYAVAPPVEVHPFGRRNVIKAFIPVTCTNCGQTTFLDAQQSTGFPIPDEMNNDPDEAG